MTRRRSFCAAALLLTAFAVLTLTCRRSDAVASDPSEELAERLFIQYLRIDSSNPPGRETPAAAFLQNALKEAGVPAQLVGADPLRQSVYSRLSSGSTQPALLLLHHLDVVPADAASWSVPPFSGRKQGGYIWGRGALDIKSLGIAQFMAFVEMSKAGKPLARDIVFLATPDEEAGGRRGIGDLISQRPDLFSNVGFVLTEGGANETIVDDVGYWGIEVEQKLPLWLRITVRGSSGHAAVPPDDGGSIAELVRILDRILEKQQPERVTPGVRSALASLAKTKKGEKAEILADIDRFMGTPRVAALSPAYRALLRNTVVITRFQAGGSVNTIPAEAWADLDVRLLPDEQPSGFVEEIRSLAGGKAQVDVLLQSEPVPASSFDTALARVLDRQMRRSEPGSVVGPMVGAGTSDGRYLRARGAVVYGISPFKVNYYDADSVHGRDERIRAVFFHQGVRLMKAIVRDFCLAAK